MDIYENDVRKMHQFVCPEEKNWNYAAPDSPRDGFVVFYWITVAMVSMFVRATPWKS